jgi:hypothetical protein
MTAAAAGSFDYIIIGIIGTDSAGCALAVRLDQKQDRLVVSTSRARE